MVTSTGFSLILYLRLHLIVDCLRLLRAILFTILGIGFPLEIIIIIVSGAHYFGNNAFEVTVRLEIVFRILKVFQ